MLAAWLTAGEARADSHCISSEVMCGETTSWTAPQVTESCENPDGGYGFVSYDIPAGRLMAFGTSSGLGFRVAVTMNDSFVVVGPPEGTPFEFAAQLILTGSANTSYYCGCCYGFASAQIIEGSSNASTAGFYPLCGAESIQTTLSVLIRRSAGERFRIGAHLSAGGVEGGSGEIHGTLRFSGVPEGASIVSCSGFHQGAPVPVVSGSWGRLKSRYR